MDIVSHANTLPWQVDTTFFMQLINQAISAVISLTITGLAYAGLHRLLSNRSLGAKPLPDNTPARRRLALPIDTKFQEGIYDET
jgi:hypothetical protein